MKLPHPAPGQSPFQVTDHTLGPPQNSTLLWVSTALPWSFPYMVVQLSMPHCRGA